jgi:hypothetical protein
MNTENKDITIILKYYLGNNIRSDIICHVNFLLDNSVYYENFHLVVSNRELESEEIEVLVKSLQKMNKLETTYFKNIIDLMQEDTNYFFYNGSEFLVIDKNEIYIADTLNVYRITDNKILWKTPRVSYDGIELNNVDENYLYGKWNSLSGENYDEWEELVLERSTGIIIKGKSIEFNSQSIKDSDSILKIVRNLLKRLFLKKR